MSKFAVIGPLYSIVLTGVSYLSSSLISLLFIFPGTPRPYISYTREKEKVTHYIEMNEMKSIDSREGTLGPNQTAIGRPPWWMTWRLERWSDFFLSTKKKESIQSGNLEMKYHQVTSRAARPRWP